MQTSLLKDGELIDYVLEEMLNNLGTKVERMYDYAKSGRYTFGLPSGSFTNGAAGTSEVETVLSALEGSAVLIDYVHYGVPNNLHLGWMHLQSIGYSQETNQIGSLTTSKGTPVYLVDMQIVVPSAIINLVEKQSIDQWGTAARSGYTPDRATSTPASRELIIPSPVVVSSSATEEYLLVSYVWMEGGTKHYDTFTIPVETYDNDKYFHAKYSIGGATKYWMYKAGTGTYPTLDALFDGAAGPNGTFFPFTYFRHNKYSEISNTTTDAYKTSKKLVKYLGMNYDDIAEAINASPDIAAVEQAVLMLAVPAVSTNQLDQRYLWSFFNSMYLAQDAENQFRSPEQHSLSVALEVTDSWDAIQSAYRVQANIKSVVIQDSRFKMALEHSGIYKRRVAGTIGAVGTYSSAYDVYSEEVTLIDSFGTEVPMTFPVKQYKYRKQISTGFYDEVMLIDLRTVFRVDGTYSVTAGETSSILIVPLDHSITSSWSIRDREIIYARSLHLVFNSKVVTKLKWYQEELFQLVMLVVAVVVTVWSLGSTSSTLVGLLAAGSYTAAALLIVQVLLEYAIYAYAFKLFVKAVGIEAAFVVAIIAAAYGIYNEGGSSGAVAGAPTAAQLIQLSSGLISGINAELKADTEDLLRDSKEFQKTKAEQIKLLETAQELLDGNHRLDPLVIFGESPQDFYNRTVHSGNIGVVGIDAISSYVDAALTLPKLQDTLGERV